MKEGYKNCSKAWDGKARLPFSMQAGRQAGERCISLQLAFVSCFHALILVKDASIQATSFISICMYLQIIEWIVACLVKKCLALKADKITVKQTANLAFEPVQSKINTDRR